MQLQHQVPRYLVRFWRVQVLVQIPVEVPEDFGADSRVPEGSGAGTR